MLTKISLFIASAMITLIAKADPAALNYSLDVNSIQGSIPMVTESQRLANNDAPIVAFEIAVSDQAIDDLNSASLIHAYQTRSQIPAGSTAPIYVTYENYWITGKTILIGENRKLN